MKHFRWKKIRTSLVKKVGKRWGKKEDEEQRPRLQGAGAEGMVACRPNYKFSPPLELRREDEERILTYSHSPNEMYCACGRSLWELWGDGTGRARQAHPILILCRIEPYFIYERDMTTSNTEARHNRIYNTLTIFCVKSTESLPCVVRCWHVKTVHNTVFRTVFSGSQQTLHAPNVILIFLTYTFSSSRSWMWLVACYFLMHMND